MRLRSRLWWKADLQIFEICFLNEKAGSKAIPRFRMESYYVKIMVKNVNWEYKGDFPLMINTVLLGFSFDMF